MDKARDNILKNFEQKCCFQSWLHQHSQDGQTAVAYTDDLSAFKQGKMS